MMKHYVILMAIIFGMIAPSASAQGVKKKVAVYMTGNDVQDSYKKVIGAKLVSAITATNDYAAVERTADFLAAIKDEEDMIVSGEVRDSQIARLGQKFGANYVVVADVSEMFEELFIASRMIKVETGLVEKAFEANGPAESMSQLIDIATKVAKGLMGAGNSQTSSTCSAEKITPKGYNEMYHSHTYGMGQEEGNASIWVDFYAQPDHLKVIDGEGNVLINRMIRNKNEGGQNPIPFHFKGGSVTVVIETSTQNDSSWEYVLNCPH